MNRLSPRASQQLLFYLGLPVVIGFLLGANQAGIGRGLPWIWSVVFWVTTTLGSWLVFDGVTAAAARALAPWKPPLIAILVVGALVASIPTRWLIYRYVGLYTPLLISGAHARPPTEFSFSLGFLLTYLKLWGGILLLWIGANLVFDRVVGLPRYRAAGTTLDAAGVPAPPTVESTAAPAAPAHLLFFRRLPAALGANIVALQSEDHYLRVHTDRGDALILYRLGDAMAELEAAGIKGVRVHRSYWIANAAVSEVKREGRNMVIVTHTGLRTPVSQTYREMVRLAGLDVGVYSPA